MEIRAYGDGPVTIGPSSLLPFDLVADTVDDNGLPLNPKWEAQRKDPNGPLPDPDKCSYNYTLGSYSCTNQFTYLNGATICGPHINWFGSTYQGKIKWSGHECPGVGDDDYNMLLLRKDSAGYTANNPGSIKCEFDSDETIDHFSTTWWSAFHSAVDADGCHCPVGCNPTHRAGRLIDESYVIVTGLVGLDVEHGIHSEVHPVWAMAMNVQPSVEDDLWVFFVRNWGNEGYCGTSQEYIDFPNNTYTFRLPWRDGATSVSVTDKTRVIALDVKDPSWTVRQVPGNGVFVTFTLDTPRDNGSLWEGELHLQWKGQGIVVEPRAKRSEFTTHPEREEAKSVKASKKKAKKRTKKGILVKPVIVSEGKR